ncbi:DUF2085 domain-containing protein [Paenibacillus sp. 2TAF8]|uniref:DUF2085 domain-containing protein n=1 Tax=Paenibacillus sp. 2TAF8 TaxID=3233020 RepID=UPI003F96B355
MIDKLNKLLQHEFTNIKSNYGVIPLCNKKPERAPHFGTFCLPLCWRCTCVVSSLLFCYFMHLHSSINYEKLSWVSLGGASIVLIAPMVWDGWRQYGYKRESTNYKRIVTGVLCGIGLWLGINLIMRLIS